MSLSFDVYWSFRSPYSYLVTPRLLDLAARHHVVCQVRPVYPLAVRTPEFFEQQDPLWVRYFMTDVFREARSEEHTSELHHERRSRMPSSA